MDESLVGVVTCRTCNKSGKHGDEANWHPYRHPIVAYVANTTQFEFAKPGSLVEDDVHSAAPFPFDPVLRQALVNKGVLTIDDLIEADKQIRMISGMVSDDVPPPVSRNSGQPTNVFQQGPG